MQSSLVHRRSPLPVSLIIATQKCTEGEYEYLTDYLHYHEEHLNTQVHVMRKRYSSISYMVVRDVHMTYPLVLLVEMAPFDILLPIVRNPHTNLEVRDDDGIYPIMLVRSTHVLKAMLERGVRTDVVDKGGRTILHHYASRARLDLIRDVMGHTPDDLPHFRTSSGFTAWQFASDACTTLYLNSHGSVVEYLLRPHTSFDLSIHSHRHDKYF